MTTRLLFTLLLIPGIPVFASDTVAELRNWLSESRKDRPPIGGQKFSSIALDKDQSASAEQLLRKDREAWIREERAEEVEAGEVRAGDKTMRYLQRSFRKRSGRSLYLSLHGGGGGPAAMNDQQWRNQARLYRPAEGIYLAPRAPTNTWNLWHQAHIDGLFDRLIENLVVFEGVNPDRVYVLGYSAGGDGVYQLAPRMSDRFAGAAMMAGHPNETSPVGLRNIPFALQVGELDSPYKRNEVAAKWGKELAALRQKDPGGYEHLFELHKGKGHWMDLDDRQAIPWMAGFDRRRYPDRVVWKQDDVTHSRFYWLALPEGQVAARQLIVAGRDGQVVEIEKAEKAKRLSILLHDEMLDLDRPVTVKHGEKVLFEGSVPRTIATIAKGLEERGLPGIPFSARVTVELE